MKPMTVFLDLDGTVFKHEGKGQAEQVDAPLLPGARDAVNELLKYGHYVVLTTGRREHLRAETIKQLEHNKIAYDQLIMGLPPGPRVVVNDQKPDGSITAGAVSHERNTVNWWDHESCVGLSSWASQKVPKQAK